MACTRLSLIKRMIMQKGRDKGLIDERNLRFARLYMTLRRCGIAKDVVIRELCKVFYLSEFRVKALIREIAGKGLEVDGVRVRRLKEDVKPDKMEVKVRLNKEHNISI